MNGRHGVQCEAQCVACATLTLSVWHQMTNLSPAAGRGSEGGACPSGRPNDGPGLGAGSPRESLAPHSRRVFGAFSSLFLPLALSLALYTSRSRSVSLPLACSLSRSLSMNVSPSVARSLAPLFLALAVSLYRRPATSAGRGCVSPPLQTSKPLQL